MPHPITTVLSAATVVAALWLSGCSRPAPQPAANTAPPTTTTAPAAPQGAPLPDQVVLIDLLTRLADPAVAGTAKLSLVEGASAGDATSLDNFTKALLDNHMVPLTFTAEHLAWSDRHPGNVVADVTARGPDPKTGGLSFPMEFTPTPNGWQLSRQTADMLLVFGDSAGPPPDQPPPPPPGAPTPPAPGPVPPAAPSPVSPAAPTPVSPAAPPTTSPTRAR